MNVRAAKGFDGWERCIIAIWHGERGFGVENGSGLLDSELCVMGGHARNLVMSHRTVFPEGVTTSSRQHPEDGQWLLGGRMMSGFWEAPPFVGKRTFQLIGSCMHWARRDIQSLPSIHPSAGYIRPSAVLGHEEPSVRRSRDFRRPSWHMMEGD